jgi:hypothetical protein
LGGLSGGKQQPWGALIHAQAQLRRSSTQPLFKPLTSLFEKACQLAAKRQFDDFAPAAEHPLRRDEPQLIAALDRLGVTALVLEHFTNRFHKW